MHPSAEQATGLSQRLGTAKFKDRYPFKLSVCRGEKGRDRAVCRGRGGVWHVMPPVALAGLAMFLALLFKDHFSEERKDTMKLQIQACLEM